MPIRVLTVDDSPLFLEVLAGIVASAPGLEPGGQRARRPAGGGKDRRPLPRCRDTRRRDARHGRPGDPRAHHAGQADPRHHGLLAHAQRLRRHHPRAAARRVRFRGQAGASPEGKLPGAARRARGKDHRRRRPAAPCRPASQDRQGAHPEGPQGEDRRHRRLDRAERRSSPASQRAARPPERHGDRRAAHAGSLHEGVRPPGFQRPWPAPISQARDGELVEPGSLSRPRRSSSLGLRKHLSHGAGSR